MNERNKLIVALDMESLDKAQELVKILKPKVKIFKIGMQLFTAYGPKAVEIVKNAGAEVFLDLKFHDIPSTVSLAACEAVKMGVFMFNVHCLGGKAMLTAASQAVKDAADKRNGKKPLLLGVTILTSMDRAELNRIGIAKSARKQVINLAILAKSCGLDGVVCSGEEIEIIKKTCGKDFITVVPGIRPAGKEAGDQKRVTTPSSAIKSGADFIVVGRPITESPDPLKAAESIIAEMYIA